MLRDIIDILFAAARRQGTGDVELLFKAQPELRSQVRSALVDGGPSFVHGLERWAAGDWDLSPSPSRSRSREDQDRLKNSRRSKDRSVAGRRRSRGRGGGRSSSRGGQRSKQERKRGSSSGSGRKRKMRRSKSASSSENSSSSSRSRSKNGREKAEQAPAAQLASFTTQELQTLSISKLREHCVQRNCLPAGMLERSDLVQALERFAVVPVGGAFTKQDLQTLSVSTLRNLCVQRSCLPTGMLERSDLVRALEPFAVETAPTVPQQQPASMGRFTRSMLQAMPTKELKALCVQKKVLPPAALDRDDFIQALVPFVTQI